MSELIQAGGTASTDGVLGRRILAWLIDALLVAVLLAILYATLAVLGLVTFGLGWLLFAVLPAVPFAYTFLFVATQAATPGQRALGLCLAEHTTLRPPTPVEALVWAALYAVFVTFLAPVLLLALITPRNRAPHDVLAGLLLLRSDLIAGR
jgi:uncharacterized RDD family membrane protein YckC